MTKLPSVSWTAVIAFLVVGLPIFTQTLLTAYPPETVWWSAAVVTLLFGGLKALQEYMTRREAAKQQAERGIDGESKQSLPFWFVLFFGEKNRA